MSINAFLEFDIQKAGKYHSWYASSAGRELGMEQCLAMQRALGEPGGRSLLEVGCGTGYFTDMFVRSGFGATGVDNSGAMIQVARETYGRDLNLIMADAGQLPFPDGRFDVVVFATSLEFMPGCGPALSEAQRVARSEMVFLMLNPDHPMNIRRRRRDRDRGGVFADVRFQRPRELEALFAQNGGRAWRSSLTAPPEDRSYYVMKITRA